MKKLTLLSLLLMSFLMNAQCTITGKSTIKVLAEISLNLTIAFTGIIFNIYQL